MDWQLYFLTIRSHIWKSSPTDMDLTWLCIHGIDSKYTYMYDPPKKLKCSIQLSWYNIQFPSNSLCSKDLIIRSCFSMLFRYPRNNAYCTLLIILGQYPVSEAQDKYAVEAQQRKSIILSFFTWRFNKIFGVVSRGVLVSHAIRQH